MPIKELNVPEKCIGTIIGRGGQNINTIERLSGASVSCKKTLCVLNGTHQAIANAVERILDIVDVVTNSPKVQVRVPAQAAARVPRIGHRALEYMTKKSGARISFQVTDRGTFVTLRGTENQRVAALNLIAKLGVYQVPLPPIMDIGVLAHDLRVLCWMRLSFRKIYLQFRLLGFIVADKSRNVDSKGRHIATEPDSLAQKLLHDHYSPSARNEFLWTDIFLDEFPEPHPFFYVFTHWVKYRNTLYHFQKCIRCCLEHADHPDIAKFGPAEDWTDEGLIKKFFRIFSGGFFRILSLVTRADEIARLLDIASPPQVDVIPVIDCELRAAAWRTYNDWYACKINDEWMLYI